MSIKFDELIVTIGLPQALALIKARGGTRIHVPKLDGIRPDTEIASIVGIEAARACARRWGGERLMLPRAVAYMRRERARTIRSERGKLTAAELALKYQITERSVFKIWSEE